MQYNILVFEDSMQPTMTVAADKESSCTDQPLSSPDSGKSLPRFTQLCNYIGLSF